MPGVPSGRGCNACRKQKKKCDLAEFPCARCKRLKIPCLGWGEQRYKFVNNEDDSPKSTSRPSSLTPRTRTTGSPSVAGTSSPRHDLSTDQSRLASAFISRIRASNGVRYNLAWTFGDYFREIPARLGHNDALDKATDALLVVVGRFSPATIDMSAEIHRTQSLALTALRQSLNNPVTAKAPETLCAVMLLMICEMFISPVEGVTTTHAEGLALIVKLRGRPSNSTLFETKLLLAMRAAVLFEALFNDKISFSNQEWVDLFESDQDELSLEGKAVKWLSQLPNLMRRANVALQSPIQPNAELIEIQTSVRKLRDDLEAVIDGLRERWLKVRADVTSAKRVDDIVVDLMNCHFLRSYTLGLAVTIFVNEILIATTPEPFAAMHESWLFAKEIVSLAAIAYQYRPLGSCVFGVCLIAAEMGSGDPAVQHAAFRLRWEYEKDFRGPDAMPPYGDISLVTRRPPHLKQISVMPGWQSRLLEQQQENQQQPDPQTEIQF